MLPSSFTSSELSNRNEASYTSSDSATIEALHSEYFNRSTSQPSFVEMDAPNPSVVVPLHQQHERWYGSSGQVEPGPDRFDFNLNTHPNPNPNPNQTRDFPGLPFDPYLQRLKLADGGHVFRDPETHPNPNPSPSPSPSTDRHHNPDANTDPPVRSSSRDLPEPEQAESPEAVATEKNNTQSNNSSRGDNVDFDRHHRTTCHRCGNLRARKLLCSHCPHIFCHRCAEKMREEHGPAVFSGGCPVCKELCCCGVNRSATCTHKYHCYKKCPTTKKPTLTSEYIPATRGNIHEEMPAYAFTNVGIPETPPQAVSHLPIPVQMLPHLPMFFGMPQTHIHSVTSHTHTYPYLESHPYVPMHPHAYPTYQYMPTHIHTQGVEQRRLEHGEPDRNLHQDHRPFRDMRTSRESNSRDEESHTPTQVFTGHIMRSRDSQGDGGGKRKRSRR